MIEKLQEFRNQLELDLMFCTTRDAHIRLAQRIATLDLIILQSSSEASNLSDTTSPHGMVGS